MKHLAEFHRDLVELKNIYDNWPSVECNKKITDIVIQMSERIDILKEKYQKFFNGNLPLKVYKAIEPLLGDLDIPMNRQKIRNGIYEFVNAAAASGEYNLETFDIDDVYYMIIVDVVINEKRLF